VAPAVPAEAEAVTAVAPAAPAEAEAVTAGAPATLPPAAPPPPEEHGRQHEEVEQELQRILTEAGVDAQLQGILADARSEAERRGVAFDTDLLFQALCDELNGSARLSDVKREQLRSMFATIIAEEQQTASVGVQHEEAPAAAS
jgi:hypothetical protein